MIVELGHLALVIALGFSALLTLSGLAGGASGHQRFMAATPSFVAAQFVFTALAYATLTYAFVNDDFSVAYVAANSNSLLPWYYKFSAVWGAHEGSFLLWTLIMSGWTLAVAVKGRDLPDTFLARVLGVMGLLSFGFLSFMLWTSNPFDRLVPMTPAEGADLNPLLQDFGLVVHPPMLYTGYVGFSVAFSFAIAALLSGRLDTAWARWSRPWTNIAWAFLTLGITLGSWWAYYELGWGGWWFWDPVENASFMPWLAGTALVHCLAVTEKRGAFKSWTLLLAITTFSLSLLGAFIVRSGVLTSVHAFAVDPTRGIFILVFLFVVVGGSLLLYAARASVIRSSISYQFLSREAFLLLNNILLITAMALVLLGTLYPLAYEAVTGGDKISVGVPYFNAGFVPLMLVVAAALGIAPALNWKRTSPVRVYRELRWVLAASVVLGIAVPLLASGVVRWQIALTLLLAFWIVGSHLLDLSGRLRKGVRRIPLAYLGMSLAHMGFAAALLGVALTSQLSVEKDLPVLGIAVPLLASGVVRWQIALTLLLAFWIVGSHLLDLSGRLRKGVRRIPLAYLGMSLAHMGFAAALLGVALTSQLSVEKDLRMGPGDTFVLGEMDFEFTGSTQVSGPNYVAQRGTFSVREGATRFVMQPEKRSYLASRLSEKARFCCGRSS